MDVYYDKAVSLINKAVREQRASVYRHEVDVCRYFFYLHVKMGKRYVSVPVHVKYAKNWQHCPIAENAAPFSVTLDMLEDFVSVSPVQLTYRNRLSSKSLKYTC
jgi:hypothetical protein